MGATFSSVFYLKCEFILLHRRQGTNYKDKKKVLGARQGAVRGLYDGQDCIVHQQLAGGEWVLER